MKISEREVQKLYERYALFLRSDVKEAVKDALNQVVSEHGGIILSIDGVQPEKGNETLYVIREVLSGMILAAKNLKSSATQELKNFIHKDIAKPLVEKDRKLKANMKRNCGGYEILNAKLRICQRNPRNGKWLPLTYQQYVRFC